MSIDTAAKRSSALDHEEPWQFGIPLPDGAISQADRQHLAFCYSGILIVESVTEELALTAPGRDYALSALARDYTLTAPGRDLALTPENQNRG